MNFNEVIIWESFSASCHPSQKVPTPLRSHTQPSLTCLTHDLRLFVNRTASELSVEAKEEGERQAAATWPYERVLLCIAIAFVIVMSILRFTVPSIHPNYWYSPTRVVTPDKRFAWLDSVRLVIRV